MMRKLQFLICLILINVGVICRGELFTALADIEPLLTTQKRVIDSLNVFINREKEKLDVLKTYLTMYEREHTKAMEDIPDYLGNPINAFILIKRMTIDLEFIQLVIDSGAEHAKSMAIMQYENATYPSAEDLGGAVVALTRLQVTYLLKIEDLADGILHGAIHRTDIPDTHGDATKAFSSKMSARDCFDFGRILFIKNYIRNALDWFMIALQKIDGRDKFISFKEIDLLQYISVSHKFLGNTGEALEWTKKMLELNPDHPVALKNAIKYQKIIDAESKGDSPKIDKKERNMTFESQEIDEDVNEYEMYKLLCRGEGVVSPAVSKQLKCLYYNETPFLKLAPIKMEYKYINPDIVLFHEVLSDEEIETITNMAHPRLERAVVHDDETGDDMEADYRISKSAWLDDMESPVVERVSRRVSDLTGLDMNTSELLQVVNYGIGGHYMPHFDHAESPEFIHFPSELGNRIATVMFYMSDVAQGGATVFTELGLSVFPVRGSAVVWFNLHPSGEGDDKTRHAACPVLRGTKWVSNKWIRSVGQEFRKPCDLEYRKKRDM